MMARPPPRAGFKARGAQLHGDDGGQRPPIRQAHEGSHDLTFGPAVYRPEHTGYNNAQDVARLADYLDAVRPQSWTAADLERLRDAAEAEEHADELAFAREWFPVPRDLYRGARRRGQALVHESIY
jgi:hypothetical protein